MAYATPGECRVKTVGLTTVVVPDVSSTGLNLTNCIAEADALIDEAARAGDYAAPFETTPGRIRDLSAIGAIARARRALELGNQGGLSAEFDNFAREFAEGLRLLRAGAMDLGTAVVSAAPVTMAADYSTWARLAYGGVKKGSVTLTSSGGVTTYVEDRGGYDPDYRPDTAKDYEVDYAKGRLRRLSGGRIGAGETVEATYEYYLRQPADAQDAEYAGASAATSELRRGD